MVTQTDAAGGVYNDQDDEWVYEKTNRQSQETSSFRGKRTFNRRFGVYATVLPSFISKTIR